MTDIFLNFMTRIPRVVQNDLLYRKQFISQFPPPPNEAGEDFNAQYNQKWFLITGKITTVFQRLQGSSRAHVISVKRDAIFGTLHQFAFEQKMLPGN